LARLILLLLAHALGQVLLLRRIVVLLPTGQLNRLRRLQLRDVLALQALTWAVRRGNPAGICTRLTLHGVALQHGSVLLHDFSFLRWGSALRASSFQRSILSMAETIGSGPMLSVPANGRSIATTKKNTRPSDSESRPTAVVLNAVRGKT